MRMASLMAVTAIALTFNTWAQAKPLKDPLETAAMMSPLSQSSWLTAVAPAGNDLVAVGSRGHILLSENGREWEQAQVPVSVDLTSVFFVDDQNGWAVGHDGVVLHSSDGGNSWSKQLDGMLANKIMKEYYSALEAQGDEEAIAVLPEVDRMVQDGPVLPFFDVWFKNRNEGFVVGAFNFIFRTVDGGVTWEPWFHRTDNDSRSHLYAIQGNGDDVFIAAELGLVLKLDDNGERFVPLDTGYDGSFFGLAAGPGQLLVYGLQGHAYRSTDDGQSWERIETGVTSSIVAGDFLPDGRVALGTQGGTLLVEDANGQLQRQSSAGVGMLTAIAAVATSDNSDVSKVPLAVIGSRGTGLVELN